MEYYLAIKRNEAQTHFENTMLSERSQSHKAMSCMVLCLGNVRRRSMQRLNTDQGVQGLGRANGGSDTNGHGVF
jgi:hypothetical protein